MKDIFTRKAFASENFPQFSNAKQRITYSIFHIGKERNKKMKDNKIKKLTLAALFTALTCVSTMIIKIPTVGTGGYIHLGDTFVVLSGIFLGPLYGGLAAGIGSALADLLGGYFVYVPITFVVKAVIAIVVALVYHKLTKKLHLPIAKCVICGIFSTVLVAFGYFAFEYFIYGATAAASIPANLIQGLSGLIISTMLLPVLSKIHLNVYQS